MYGLSRGLGVGLSFGKPFFGSLGTYGLGSSYIWGKIGTIPFWGGVGRSPSTIVRGGGVCTGGDGGGHYLGPPLRHLHMFKMQSSYTITRLFFLISLCILRSYLVLLLQIRVHELVTSLLCGAYMCAVRIDVFP